jgi:hypothetical protein
MHASHLKEMEDALARLKEITGDDDDDGLPASAALAKIVGAAKAAKLLKAAMSGARRKAVVIGAPPTD